MRRSLTLLLVLSIALNFWNPPTQAAVQAASTDPQAPAAPATPAAVDDVPTTLVASGVAEYALAIPKLFWWSGVTGCPPGIAQAPLGYYTETISRMASYGSTVRTLFSQAQDCGVGTIDSDNIAADSDFIYWLRSTGLYRLSTDANPGDPPQLMNSLVHSPGMVAVASDRVYVISNNNGSSTELAYVLKSNNARVHLISMAMFAYNLKVDGQYVYYTVGTNLYRVNPGVDNGVLIGTGVSGYYPEGVRTACAILNGVPVCFSSNYVYLGKGRYVYRYDNDAGTTTPSALYTSTDSTASIFDMVSDSSNLYFLESRTVDCGSGCLASYFGALMRTSRAGTAPAALYTSSIFPGSPPIANLNTDGTFLFWQESGGILRLPNNASAMPIYQMHATGMEVTQAIQDLSNSIVLIKNKHTFVRVYVKATTKSVPNVTAMLEATSMPGEEPLLPVNSAGTTITVRTNPDRSDINQSFLFELPWNWTQQSSLTLKATLNPYHVPLEDTFADNTTTTTVTFNTSPTLSAEFFRLSYTLNGISHTPRMTDDVLKTYSWILRAYPLGGGIGDSFKPRVWDVDGGALFGTFVNTTNPICALLYNKPKDDISLCASYIGNGMLNYYRFAGMYGQALNPSLTAFYYGMISDGAGFFPRGQAMYYQTSVGPSGVPGGYFNLGQGWDTDGSYADWYAAHEIGHSLGRDHPFAGSDDANTDARENCGHSRTDPFFPYGSIFTSSAPIGPASGSTEGFDVGDPTFNIQPAVLPSTIWNDVMSYCNNQWISDYTYTGMYTYMKAHPSVALSPASALLTGDFLILSGAINPADNSGAFAMVRRTNSVIAVSSTSQVTYSLRQYAANNSLLSNQNIDTTLAEDTGLLGFSHVMALVSGARRVDLVRNSDSHVLATTAISAHAPTVSNVAFQGLVTIPLSGVVTLGWNASDADGDPLTFDIAYSRDNGATFQPVVVGISGTSAQVNTADLGGSGTARLRVIASDGVNTGFADGAQFTMGYKPPQPYILSPANNINVQYGQLVNFQGMAFDAQDSTVADSGLTWWKGATNLGTGPLLSLADLPVGTNIITLHALNSTGQSTNVNVTVIVNDNLDLPGPNLSAGPLNVGWQVAAGSVTNQTATISIDNLGSGVMNWTAAKSTAPWLGLSATSGSVTAAGDASVLTLTANPSGLAAGVTYTALVTLTQPVSLSNPTLQTIVIPVSLSVGAVEILPASPLANGWKKEFLPVVWR